MKLNSLSSVFGVFLLLRTISISDFPLRTTQPLYTSGSAGQTHGWCSKATRASL